MNTTTRQPNAAGRGGDIENRRPPSELRGERRRIADIIIPEGRHASETSVLELAASMEELGQLQPIIITPDHVLVAGLHRLRACERRGCTEIDVIIVHLDELRTELAGIDENLTRKALTALERAELMARRKEIYEALHPEAARPRGGRPPKNGDGMSPFSLNAAGLVGCDQRTVQTDVQIATAIPQDVRDAIRSTTLADHKTDMLKLAREDEATQRKLAEKLADGTARHLYEARRAVRLDEAQQFAAGLPTDARGARVLACSAEELIGDVDAGSVDLILTDPPYGQDALSAYDELGRLAAHALAPAGSLLVMVGQMHLYEIMTALRAHLHYRWTLAYLVRSGGSPIVPTVICRVNSWWKPVLWFTRPDYDGDVHGDVIDSGLKSKEHDEWEQDVAGMARLVELFSLPDQLVVDPFLGTGTTGIAAVKLGRRFVGCDVAPESVSIARARIHDASAQQDA